MTHYVARMGLLLQPCHFVPRSRELRPRRSWARRPLRAFVHPVQRVFPAQSRTHTSEPSSAPPRLSGSAHSASHGGAGLGRAGRGGACEAGRGGEGRRGARHATHGSGGAVLCGAASGAARPHLGGSLGSTSSRPPAASSALCACRSPTKARSLVCPRVGSSVRRPPLGPVAFCSVRRANARLSP